MRRYRWVALVAVVTLVAAGCGRSDETTQADDPPAGDETPGGDNGDGGSSGEPGLADGAFGDLGVICRPAPDGVEPTDSGDPGVTADSIQVSTFSDPGYSGRQGLNQELFDTAEAFTAWCNEHGGINGRRIDLKLRDAKLFEFQQRVIEACDQGDFFTVGGGAVFDDTGQADRLSCGLPQIAGYLVTGVASASDLSVQPVPNPNYQLPVGDMVWLAEQFPESTDAVGIFTGQLPTTVTVANRYKEAITDLGWKIVYEGQYNPVGEETWRPFLEDMRSRGVRGLIWVGEPSNLAQLMTEATSIGVNFDWVRTDANHYDPQIPDNAGDAADGIYVRSVFHPFLDPDAAAENLATQQYLDLIDRYDPGGKVAYLGVQALSAWLLFAKAADECGADLTRDCVMTNAKSITEWTGGGLHARQNLSGGGKASDCFNLFVMEGGEFTLAGIDPNEGIYRCESGNVVELTGDYGTGAACPGKAPDDDPLPSECNA